MKNNQSYLSIFEHLINQKSLSHAYLFNGLDVLFMQDIVHKIIQYFFCTSPQKSKKGSCQQCKNCLSIKDRDFSGIMEINDPKQMIRIDQIRNLTSVADYSDLSQKANFFIINHAELMNENSQNALLKHLESPADNRYFFLLTQNKYLLLPTIVSRCEIVYFQNNLLLNKKLEDPLIMEFVRLLSIKNPLAYIILMTNLKPKIKEQGSEFFLYALLNAYHKIKDTSEKSRQLILLSQNLPQVRLNIDFERLMEMFCLEVLSED